MRARTLLAVVPLLVACGGTDPDQERADEPDTVAKLLDPELSYGTLWLSESDEPGQAATECLEHVFGWSVDPERISPDPDPDGEMSEKLDIEDPERQLGHPVGFDAESPAGLPLVVTVQAGDQVPPGDDPDPDDDRWRVVGFGVDPQVPPW